MFKSWMLNESPDAVGLPVQPKAGDAYGAWKGITEFLNWKTGYTFFLFENYYIYTKQMTQFSTTHNSLLRKLTVIYESDILPTYLKSITPQELDEKIKEELEVNSIGTLNQTALEQIVEITKMYENSFGKSLDTEEVETLRNEFGEIKDWPEILLGRIWPQNKTISFWNRDSYVFAKSNQILDFIDNWSDPKAFRYEITNNQRYELYSYEEFSHHSKSRNPQTVAPPPWAPAKNLMDSGKK